MSAVFEARAKLNLSLDVLGKRDDGYHEMKMVMQSVSLCDEVELDLRPDVEIRLKSNLRYLPGDERNIAVRAAKLFFDEFGITDTGVDISLKKRVPVCAGLGGGSSDAAAVLRGLADLTGIRPAGDELERLGAKLGSDVPFCVYGGTRLALGRGDELENLSPLPDCRIVICKPAFSISTPELFKLLDVKNLRCHPDTAVIIGMLSEKNLVEVARRMYNVFEDILPRQYGEVSVIKSRLLDCGALGVVMSGTGSAVFGLFETENAAKRAFDELRGSYKDCFLTEPTGNISIQ